MTTGGSVFCINAFRQTIHMCYHVCRQTGCIQNPVPLQAPHRGTNEGHRCYGHNKQGVTPQSPLHKGGNCHDRHKNEPIMANHLPRRGKETPGLVTQKGVCRGMWHHGGHSEKGCCKIHGKGTGRSMSRRMHGEHRVQASGDACRFPVFPITDKEDTTP